MKNTSSSLSNESLINNKKNKLSSPIAIIGMAVSGEATLRLLLNLGYQRSEILTYDQKPSPSTQTTEFNDVINFKPQTMVVSPGVPLGLPWIQELIQSGVKLINEIDLASSYLTHEIVIGITGSIGKSTTAALVAEAAEAWTPHIFLGGNFGDPLANYISDLIEQKRKPAELVVVELSSYHLETLQNSIFDLSAITYFTANHLERYSSIESYYATKWRLPSLTKGTCLLNHSSHELVEWSKSHPQSNLCFYKVNDPLIQSTLWSQMKMIGLHNQENIACAAKIIKEVLNLVELKSFPKSKEEVFQDSIFKLLSFKGLSHRMENLGSLKNALFINDSKATTIESVLTAVKGVLGQFPETHHLFLLLGGKDKNLPWNELKDLSLDKRIKPYFFGSCGTIAKNQGQLGGEVFKSLGDCLKALKIDLAKLEYKTTQNIVLLSPGGTSLDEFKSFEHRGEFFKDSVRQF